MIPSSAVKTTRRESFRIRLLLCLIALLPAALYAGDITPMLQWVTSTGGFGSSSVTASGVDSKGNFYIVGTTTSLDFPVTMASQASAGGSTLARLSLATGTGSKLYPGGLSSITAAAAAPGNPNLLIAAAGNSIFSSADAGSTFSLQFAFPSTTSVSSLAIDPGSASTVYAGTSSQGLYKSTDGAITWTAINNGIPNTRGSLNIGGIWIAPSTPNVLFAASGSGLLRSADGGATWSAAAPGDTYSTFVAFDPSQPASIYLAFGNGVSHSADNGNSFQAVSGLPKQSSALSLVADRGHAGTIYASSTGGLYQSTDSGVTWNLKVSGVVSALAVDPASSAIYAKTATGVIKSTDGFTTQVPVGSNVASVRQLLVSGQNLFEVSQTTTDTFAVKLDNQGNIVYSTYFGGSGNDAANAVAVGVDGSLYLAGSTDSADLPVSGNAYLSTPPATGTTTNFLFKLNPDGSRAWATYFAGGSVVSLTVDSTGSPFIGGTSTGNLPTTAGAYQTTFQQTLSCTGFIGCFPGPASAFVTRFNATGTGLIYSTYVPTDSQQHIAQVAQALAVDASGNVWIGVGNPNLVTAGYGPAVNILELNPTGSALLGAVAQSGLGSVAGIALDGNSNVYIAGSYTPQTQAFPATPGAFQPAQQPVIPQLPYGATTGGGLDAFVAKFDVTLTHLLAATLLGGELQDGATSIAVDPSGMVIVGGFTDSRAFPTHAPFQEAFSPRSGFVAAFDPNLSSLLFSTYLGDGRSFVPYGAFPDGKGNVLLAGSTLTTGSLFLGGDPGASYTTGALVFANKIALPSAPALRLDSVQNYADHIAQGLAPGEPVTVTGAGLTGAQLILDGALVNPISSTNSSLIAVLPAGVSTSGAHTLQVSNNGAVSNPMFVPAQPASPAIYSVDGSGSGQGYILNSDGTLNSAANPAAPGSAITMFVAGAGSYTLSNSYAVTDQAPSVFVDGFYCNGIAARIGPVGSLPGDVYQLSVFLPSIAALVANNPDLRNFTFPAQSEIKLVLGSPNALNYSNSLMVTQSGIFVNIK